MWTCYSGGEICFSQQDEVANNGVMKLPFRLILGGNSSSYDDDDQSHAVKTDTHEQWRHKPHWTRAYGRDWFFNLKQILAFCYLLIFANIWPWRFTVELGNTCAFNNIALSIISHSLLKGWVHQGMKVQLFSTHCHCQWVVRRGF